MVSMVSQNAKHAKEIGFHTSYMINNLNCVLFSYFIRNYSIKTKENHIYIIVKQFIITDLLIENPLITWTIFSHRNFEGKFFENNASSSTPNISQALTEGDDLDTAVNRAFYYEPVIHALKKYSFFGITEEDIARTVEKSTGDGELYTNLILEHREALSTLDINNLSSLYHLLFLFYESFDFIQASVSKGMENACKEFV
ncbi:hypothetical protein RhiirA4_417890 [Rhizophagus irregularis]|uniref:Uncharacterized protein n=1 Tax=Rhizophagus irregularis TaxID=588596 RepID=A0A2I1G8K4_9GLOM|nr:hypothetical protein RhiirA4_417890 [Rhizophagus irregularis]